MLLPRVRSYISPFCTFMSSFHDTKKAIVKNANNILDIEMKRALEFLKPIFEVDPAVHINYFLNLLPPHKIPLWSDASGFEIDSKNPTPGMLGSVFIPPFVKTSQLIWKVTAWKDIVPLLERELVHGDNNHSWSRSDFSPENITICFLELAAAMLTLYEMLLLCIQSKKFFKRFSRKIIIMKIDNQNVCSWINRGRCPFYPWHHLMEVFFLAELALQCQFKAIWVPSAKQFADRITRGELNITYNNQILKATTHSRKAIASLVKHLVHGVDIKLSDYFERFSANKRRRNVKVCSPPSRLPSSGGPSLRLRGECVVKLDLFGDGRFVFPHF